MDLRAEDIAWDTPAGKLLDHLARSLPAQPSLEITVFGSAPLQLFLDRNFLSADVDVFPSEEAYDFLLDFVAKHEMDESKARFYIQVCDPNAFRTARDWVERALKVERCGHTFRFPHPWDILASKLQRLDEKDIKAFQLVVARTGHPTEEEFTKHLQKAVDLYRPKFDEESSLGDIFNNTQLLWQTLWQKSIDVRAAIIRPALERSAHDCEGGDASFKARLASLRLPGDTVR
ncbi:MAG TPA: DUF6036 family nucleotidyltransferase [Candidatus Dormibacteraeota bacterium]|nr:DUF6036 family nucleotidyltransferase [Candidatus Dormibacteraeota bacterium]